MGKYFPEIAKVQEFLELNQGAMTVMDYVARFTELARFADDYVATNLAKVRRFENGLKLSIRARIVGVRPEKFQFLEKGQNRNYDYKIVISIKNP